MHSIIFCLSHLILKTVENIEEGLLVEFIPAPLVEMTKNIAHLVGSKLGAFEPKNTVGNTFVLFCRCHDDL